MLIFVRKYFYSTDIKGGPIKMLPLELILYWKRETVQNIKELLQLVLEMAFLDLHAPTSTAWRCSWRLDEAREAISAWIHCSSSPIFVGSCSNTLFLRWHHKKKSRGVRSGLLGAHNDRLMSHSGKNSCKNSIIFCTVCAWALSCWNTQSRSSSSRRAMNWWLYLDTPLR